MLPLENLRVIDITQNVAGPYAAMILAELGAAVTKIEPPRGDATRSWGPPFWNGYSASYLALNRNKDSLKLDLTTPKGKKALLQLISKADVFLESGRLGSMKRLRLDYANLRKINPRLIYAELTAFGITGPRASEAGYDPLMQAVGGIMSVTGRAGQEPTRVGVSIVDMATGMWTAISILGALRLRDKTGRGHKVTTALYETAIAWMAIQFGSYWASGVAPTGWGSGVSMISPYEAFRATDGWVVIGAGNDKLFESLSTVLTRPEWALDQRFANNADRVKNRVELHDLIEAITITKPKKYWERTLKKMNIPVALLLTLDDVSKDSQLRASGIVQSIKNPKIKNFKSIGLPLRIDGDRPPLRMPPPE
ncbi:MAG: CoA transferase [Thaumarchaeota archaeon]|nr:CoA transferase [Nitrososphaerota archaeon]